MKKQLLKICSTMLIFVAMSSMIHAATFTVDFKYPTITSSPKTSEFFQACTR